MPDMKLNTLYPNLKVYNAARVAALRRAASKSVKF
jgi:hypothetical protein